MDFERLERYRDLVGDWQAFAECQERPLRSTLWTNTLRLTPEELRAYLAEDGVDVEPLSWYPGGFRWLSERSPGKVLAHPLGLYQIQEEVSMMPVALLDPRPGMSVLDLCAAPGNKTAQAAVRMENRGRVLANDINRRRLGMIAGTLERLGVSNVAIWNYDAGNLPRGFGRFDRVLADVPCSCEGTVRRNPEVLIRPLWPGWRHNLQVAILRKALLLAKPGGRVVYSTCTYAPEENEVVVDAVLREAAERGRRLELLPAELPGVDTRPGIREWQGQSFVPEMERAMRVYPHLNDTGGFFIAVLEKGWDDEEDVSPGVEVPKEVDKEPYSTALEERFGIPRRLMDDRVVFRPNAKRLSTVSGDMRLPPKPDPWLVGIPFFRTKSKYPRLASAMAVALGRHATRNVVDIGDAEVEELVAHGELRLERRRTEGCDVPGWVLPRHRGFAVTVAYLRLNDDGAHLDGSIPKTWSRILGD